MLRGSSDPNGQRQAALSPLTANLDKIYSQASRKISRAVAKVPSKRDMADANSVQALDKLVNDYKANFAALSIKAQGCVAGSYEVEVWSEKLDAADGLITKAKKENNLERFLGTALAHIFMAVEGREVETLVIDSCDKSALCFPLAEALQDFSKDLHLLLSQKEASAQKAVQDAVAKTAQEKQKAAVQAESAVKEKAEWMQQNQKVQSQLQATSVREIAALRSIDQIKRELKEFSGGFKKRAEGLDVLEQTSYTWKTQLSAEIKRASSNEARVAMLDVRLVDTRAKVDKLAAQVAELEEEQVEKSEIVNQLTGERQELTQQVAALQGTLGTLQGFKGKLADEQARHQATLQAGAELKDQLAATQQQLTEAQQTASDFQAQLELTENRLAAQQQCLEDANQKATSSQIHLQDVQMELVAEQQACASAKKMLDTLQSERAAAQQSAASLQTELTAAAEALAAQKLTHDSHVTNLKSDLHMAEQQVSVLHSQLKGMESELAHGKQAALEAVNKSATSFLTPLKATQQWTAAEMQGQEDWYVPSCQSPVHGARQVVSALRTQLEVVQQELAEKTATETVNMNVSNPQADLQQLSVVVSLQQSQQANGHTAADNQMQLDLADCNTKQGAQGDLVGEKQCEQASAEAVADAGHQVDSLVAQRRPSPQQVATEAHASTDLAGALTQHPGRASPSSALAPAAPLTDPSCLKSKLPAQAVLRVEDYPPSLPWWNAATAGVTVFVPDCGAEDQQSVMPLEQETVPASAVASGLAAAALNPTAAALNLESEQGQQGEYVPSMPWYDPLLAPACAAAACGEPMDHSTQSSLSMFGQGVDNAAASPCEDTASDVDDAQPQVATEALALSDLAEGLSQESDRASPSSAMAPTEPLTDPNTPSPEPILPAQAVVRDRMFVSKGFQRIVEAEYDEGQHGSWREACTMFDAGVPSKVYTTPRNLLFSMLGRGASGEVHYGQKQVGRRGVKEAVALKWVPLQGDGDKQTTKQEVASLKAVGKSLARMPLPHHIICHKDDYRVKTDDGRLYHVIITGYSEGVALGEALAPHRARRHFVSLVQRCLHQTFQGIDVLHNCGWAHMHIKINNVQADISARGRQVQCQVIDLGSAIKASAREYVLRMPPWSLSPELIRAITPGTPPEAHVDNQLHDSWAMGCLFYEALTDMHLFGKHVGAYKAQAVAAHVQPGSSEQGGEQKGCLFYEALTDMHLFGKHVGAYKAQAVAAHVQPGSSEQGGEQEGEQEGGQEGEQDGEESQAAGDVHFVLLQHQLWAEDYATPAATLKLSNMLEAHIADAELRMQAVSLMLKLLHPNPYDRGTVQEALTSNFLAL